MHLRGVLHLVVMLPDSSPGTIPASATDIFGVAAAAGPAVVLDAGGLRRLRALVTALAAGGRARRAGRGRPRRRAVRARLGRARMHAERAVAELTAAVRAWGRADSVRERAEQRLAVTDLDDQRVLADPEYGQALDAGGVFAAALRAAEAALRPGMPVVPGTPSRFTPSLIAPRLREE